MKNLFYLLVIAIICGSLSTPGLAQREIAPPTGAPLTENPVVTEAPVVEPPPPSPVPGKPQVQPSPDQPNQLAAIRIKKGQTPKNQRVKAKQKTSAAEQKLAQHQLKVKKAKASYPKKLRSTAAIRRR
ncbi:MAG: hypothetical protein ACLFUU_09090 [Desulfobacteraceae bacterium]